MTQLRVERRLESPCAGWSTVLGNDETRWYRPDASSPEMALG
jgi:hypothetical protein